MNEIKTRSTPSTAGPAALASKFYIAVKELIIEWKDCQSEFVGYVHCDACFEAHDLTTLDAEPVWLITRREKNEDYVKLARFVK